jgi:hypothetical protein
MKEKNYKKITLDELKKLSPVWHLKLANIDLSKQPNKLDVEITGNDFHIYKSSWIEMYRALDPGYIKLYSKDKVFSTQQDSDKLIEIIKHWEGNTALIPPMMIDCGYNKLIPGDGKHRMKIASLVDNTEIYFILFDKQLPIINKYFNPILID